MTIRAGRPCWKESGSRDDGARRNVPHDSPRSPGPFLPDLPAQDLVDGLDRIRLVRGLVVAVTLDPREPQRDARGIGRALLHVAERDLDHLLGTHVDHVAVGADL